MQNQYETVFILNPVLSEKEIADTVDFFKTFMAKEKVQILHEEKWGVKKLAYQIKKFKTGYYYYFEFKAASEFIKKLDVTYRQNDHILRFMTTTLDKHAMAYNEKIRQKKLQNDQ